MKRDISTILLPNVLTSLSESEVKRVRLTVYLCITSIAISCIYTILDLLSGVYYALPYYAVIFVAPLLSLGLLRRQKFLVAKIAVMVGGGVAIFFAAISDPIETGVFLLFVPLSIVPFAIIGFEYKWTSIGITIITFCLFLLSSFGEFELPYVENLHPYYNQISLCLNYLISVTISILIVYFLVRLHKKSELTLIEKEKAVLEKNSQLTKLNHELDGFVYSVSHDLRSPLSSILGLTNLAKYASTKEELIEYMGMIQERIKIQDSFIKDIIEYSRNTRTELVADSVDLFKLTHEVIDSLKFNDGTTNMRYEVVIEEGFIISSDKNRWKTILSNLIGNALKYYDITKKNPFIKIVATKTENEVIYSVTDNGVGIAEKHLERIFDMFYRASESSSGSGLGLFITREAVQKLEGNIFVNSIVGEGSTFKIIIPKS